MSFVQVMQFRTSKSDELRAAVDEWERATEGRRTVRRSVICQERDNPDNHVVIVFFDSYDKAMENSELPETDALSKKTAELAEGPITFSNLDVVDDRS